MVKAGEVDLIFPAGAGSLMRYNLMTSHAFEDAPPLRDTVTSSVDVVVFPREWFSHAVLSDDFACVRGYSAAERCIDFYCLCHRISPAYCLSYGAI
jgi:hypothetical protein